MPMVNYSGISHSTSLGEDTLYIKLMLKLFNTYQTIKILIL